MNATVTLKLTLEELRMLSYQFGQRYVSGEPGNEDSDALSDNLTEALVRLQRRETP